MRVTQRDWSGLRQDGRALPRDVKIAIEWMRANIGRPIGIADLVVATGTPERTLHKHFRSFLGLAPLGFLRRLRLAAARDALLAPSGGSVTEIAARFGFAHFGRFSSEYRRCFGELPSATRRRRMSLIGSATRHRLGHHTSRRPCRCWSSRHSGRPAIGKATVWPTLWQSCSQRNLRVGASWPSGWPPPPLRQCGGPRRATA